MWVKICGLTRPEDVVAAIAAGADAIGLILVKRSPRCLTAQRASELAAVAKDRATVVVLVEEEPAAAVALAQRVGADGIQPYGANAADAAAAAVATGLGAWLPIGVAANEHFDISNVPTGAIPLLDTSVAGASGGTGRTFDWARAVSVPGAVVAGGLNPDNVADAISAARPDGVDASSGLEAAVGIKDHSKVTAFVAAARAAGNRL